MPPFDLTLLDSLPVSSDMITSEDSLAGEHNNLILNPNAELRMNQMEWSYHYTRRTFVTVRLSRLTHRTSMGVNPTTA